MENRFGFKITPLFAEKRGEIVKVQNNGNTSIGKYNGVKEGIINLSPYQDITYLEGDPKVYWNKGNLEVNLSEHITIGIIGEDEANAYMNNENSRVEKERERYKSQFSKKPNKIKEFLKKFLQ